MQSSDNRKKDKTSSLVNKRLSAIEKKLNTCTPKNKVNLSDELENRLKEITGDLLVIKELEKRKTEINKIKQDLSVKIDNAALQSNDFFHQKLEDLKDTLNNQTEDTKKQFEISLNKLPSRRDKEEYVPEWIENEKHQQDLECIQDPVSNHERLQFTWGNYDDVSIVKDIDTDTKDQEDKASDRRLIDLQHLIVGDSIIQGIKEQIFHKGQRTKIVSLKGKGMNEVRDHIERMSIQGKDPQNITIHVGSNDLNHYSPELLSKKFEDLIEYIQEKLRFSKILISLVLQKMGNYQFNRKAREVNQLLKDLCMNKKVSYVFHNNIKTDDLFRADKVHLSDRGTAVFVNNLKKQLMLSSTGDVNNDVEDINSLLINVSDRCLKVVKIKKHKKRNKEYFNTKCYNKRREV